MLRLVTLDLEAKVYIIILNPVMPDLYFSKKEPILFLLLDLQPAPPVGFNLTFVCPEGEVETTYLEIVFYSKISLKVFNHDWFATPFVLTTCQPNGVFDPPDWEIFDCVIREFNSFH